MKFYVAGSLFKDKERLQRMKEGDLLNQWFPEAEVYNPVNNDKINDKTKNPTAQEIFMGDTKEIIKSDTITADLDDSNDMGVAMELGVCYGINHMLDVIKKYAPLSVYDKIREQIPYKHVYATYSDVRQDTKGEEGIYKSVGNNMYLFGGVEEMGNIYRHFNDALNDIMTYNSEKYLNEYHKEEVDELFKEEIEEWKNDNK